MRISTLVTSAGLAAAAPAVEEKRQLFGGLGGLRGGASAAGGACDVGFVWARGSTEPSPLGITIGPKLERGLKRRVPGIKTFPVLYAASIATNVSLDRTDAASKSAGVKAFQQAAGCTSIVAGGYSQGAAVMANVLGTVNRDRSPLDAALREKVKGVALFGSTRNKQDGGKINDFPSDRVKMWCKATDGVCGGGLLVNVGHLSYSTVDVNQAVDFLVGNLKV